MNSLQQIIPYLSVRDAGEAIGFYSSVFGEEPYVLLSMPDGRVMHCEFRVGSSRFFVSEELPEHGGTPSPKSLGGTSVAMHLYVEDCDAMAQTMVANGATMLMQPTDVFWGERFARVRDPFGHDWGIATQLEEMSPDEIRLAADKMFESASE